MSRIGAPSVNRIGVRLGSGVAVMGSVGAPAVIVIIGIDRSSVSIWLSGAENIPQPLKSKMLNRKHAENCKKRRRGLRIENRKGKIYLDIEQQLASANDMEVQVMNRLTSVFANVGDDAVSGFTNSEGSRNFRRREKNFG